MFSINCLSEQSCLGNIYSVLTTKVGIVVSIIVEIALLAIGICALTHVLPNIGVIAGGTVTGIGGCLLLLTTALVGFRRCPETQAASPMITQATLPTTDPVVYTELDGVL